MLIINNANGIIAHLFYFSFGCIFHSEKRQLKYC